MVLRDRVPRSTNSNPGHRILVDGVTGSGESTAAQPFAARTRSPSHSPTSSPGRGIGSRSPRMSSVGSLWQSRHRTAGSLTPRTARGSTSSGALRVIDEQASAKCTAAEKRRHRGAVRGGLDLSARLLEDMLTNDALRVALLAATENALPWLEWLPEGDRAEFLPSFVRTVRACGDTGYYQPLERLLGEWEASAQIQHDPGLRELLEADRGTDEGVKLKRPQK